MSILSSMFSSSKSTVVSSESVSAIWLDIIALTVFSLYNNHIMKFIAIRYGYYNFT